VSEGSWVRLHCKCQTTKKGCISSVVQEVKAAGLGWCIVNYGQQQGKVAARSRGGMHIVEAATASYKAGRW